MTHFLETLEEMQDADISRLSLIPTFWSFKLYVRFNCRTGRQTKNCEMVNKSLATVHISQGMHVTSSGLKQNYMKLKNAKVDQNVIPMVE